jgi:hypothetical protein
LQEGDGWKPLQSLVGLLFENIGVDGKIESIEDLADPELYFQIYEIMFPFLSESLEEINRAIPIDNSEDCTSSQLLRLREDRMQALLDLLAEQVLKMDLGHIKGRLLTQP